MELNEPNAKYLVQAGYKQTEGGVIPVDWNYQQLTDVARLESGHTPSRRQPSYWGGNIPWISLHDTGSLNDLEILATQQYISQAGLKNSSARLLPKGTVVLSRTATVGKATSMGREMATSQDFANYVCGPAVDSHFLVYLFRYMAPEWRKLMAGSIHNTVYMPTFKSLRVVLPPKREQESIAQALQDADALIESLEQLLAKKRQIKQGAMQELLTGQRRLPGFQAEWCTVSLGEIGTFLKGSGITREQAQSGAIPCVRYGEIYTTHTDHVRSFESGISPAVAATATPLRQGDILFAGSGETKEDIGKCVAFLDDFEAYAGSDIVILRPRASDSRFLGYALNAAEVNRQKASKGQGDAVVHISAAALAQISVRAPEIAEQTAIATILSDMDTEISALEVRLTKARQLKQGMAQALLTGRIRLV
ncbi:restriction endonuclease subunit S [Hydrogenophaga sp.]|uniref:restriction endonuclease subunit S n=1 Tax=Hydrogenophaga sp. TaxID=1904254 RepID=UPI002601B67A|nr:restriction endonuclease subunit S [Hydrogenophaga sp.]